MEFISRLFIAFLSLFFDDLPFPLDDHIPSQEPVQNFPQTPAFDQSDESIFLTPDFEERWSPDFEEGWSPVITSTPKRKAVRRQLFMVPGENAIIAEVKAPCVVVVPPVVRAPLPLEGYLLSLKANGGNPSNLQAPSAAPVKRMGLRV
jgi:hypothetical protein